MMRPNRNHDDGALTDRLGSASNLKSRRTPQSPNGLRNQPEKAGQHRRGGDDRPHRHDRLSRPATRLAHHCLPSPAPIPLPARLELLSRPAPIASPGPPLLPVSARLGRLHRPDPLPSRGPSRSTHPACPDRLSRPASLTPFTAHLNHLSWRASHPTHCRPDRPSRLASIALPTRRPPCTASTAFLDPSPGPP